MKTKLKSTKISQILEQNHMENHPFAPKLISSYPNSSQGLNNTNIYSDEVTKSKTPVFEKLYR